jgi:flagellar FliJ protein
MDSIATLNTVLEHARSQRDAALAALRRAQASAEAARTQADQLGGYRCEYRQRWTERFREPGSIELLQCVQGFAGRLDQAIAMQSNTVRQTELRLQQARELVLAREQRVAAIGKLIERRLAEARRDADRREQRQLDEASTRIGMAARKASPLT